VEKANTSPSTASYKGNDWADSVDFSGFGRTWWLSLPPSCDPYYEHEQPIYEL